MSSSVTPNAARGGRSTAPLIKQAPSVSFKRSERRFGRSLSPPIDFKFDHANSTLFHPLDLGIKGNLADSVVGFLILAPDTAGGQHPDDLAVLLI